MHKSQITSSPKVDHLLFAAYQKFKDKLLIQRLRIACILNIFIVPAAGLLDVFVYPEWLTVFIFNRIICAVIAALIWWSLTFKIGHTYAHLLALIWVTTVLGYNAVMIFLSEGVLSPYYAGLILTILGASLLIPWVFTECLIACTISILLYTLACWGNWVFMGAPSSSHWFAELFNNIFMLLTNNIICLTACYFSANLRFRQYQLQFDLDRSKTQLEDSYNKLEELDQLKSQFFTNISHELRTPLTLIISPLESLMGKITKEASPNINNTLTMMHANAMRLVSLINDLLDLTKFEHGKTQFKFEPVNLNTLLPGLTSSVRGLVESKKLTITDKVEGPEHLFVHADPAQLERVFLNLIFNAIKFTPEGGTISLHAYAEDESILIHISDTGKGISDRDVPSVFDRFWQEDSSTTRTHSGTGIGLALVKEIVELHHGNITLQSQKEIGTTFTIRLPKLENIPTGTSSQEGEVHWIDDLYRKARFYINVDDDEPSVPSDDLITKPTLLIIEDDKSMQRFLISELNKEYTLCLAEDGEEGMLLAKKVKPELVLTDLMLPKLDGISICSQIRTDPDLKSTRIVLLTAKADEESKLAALQSGAHEYLTKPFSTLELKTRLSNLLLNAQLEKELQSKNEQLNTTLTQLQNTEAQLIQSERLSALGNLSAGIMHEINNPVNFMMSATGYLKKLTSEDTSEIKETVEDIEEGLIRVRDIILDLKGFAYGRSSQDRAIFEPNKLLQIVKRLLAESIRSDVTIEESIEENTYIYGNQNQLVQLTINLLQNALHATEVNLKSNKQRIISINMYKQNELFIIHIRDNGKGINPDNLSHIFDPFFTTKEAGEGTGLGLSISHTIVKNHNGTIEVQSELNTFTEFIIKLPLAEKAALSNTTEHK